MALVASVITRLDEARVVLEAARARAPDPRAHAMIVAAARLGRGQARTGRRRPHPGRDRADAVGLDRGARASDGRATSARCDRRRCVRPAGAVGRGDRPGEGVHRARPAEHRRVGDLRPRARRDRRLPRRARGRGARARARPARSRAAAHAGDCRSPRSARPRPRRRRRPTPGFARPTRPPRCGSGAPSSPSAARGIAPRCTWCRCGPVASRAGSGSHRRACWRVVQYSGIE